MIPVMQTIGGIGGNCFQACAASVLEIPLRDFPHLFQHNSPGDIWTQSQWDTVRRKVESYGLQATHLDPDKEEDEEAICKLRTTDLYYIATGKSKHGDFGHNVVMHRGELAHDPNNSGGLAGDPWLYIVFY